MTDFHPKTRHRRVISLCVVWGPRERHGQKLPAATTWPTGLVTPLCEPVPPIGEHEPHGIPIAPRSTTVPFGFHTTCTDWKLT
jgi:hypothetical protein